MSILTLAIESLRHYRRTNLAVIAGVATAVAVLAGALMVGDSVRTSLRQLAVSRLGNVDLRAYFKQLCESIGASMIRDHDQLVLEVDADDSAVLADVSVSLGLVVTELVINALKHAFPGGRPGTIVVGYHSRGSDWTLSVTDNGAGMPKDAASVSPGLGTSIVTALASQLSARVLVADAHSGTAVSLVHTQLTSVGAEPQDEMREAAR